MPNFNQVTHITAALGEPLPGGGLSFTITETTEGCE